MLPEEACTRKHCRWSADRPPKLPIAPELAILERAIQPGKKGHSEAAAAALLEMRLGKKDLDRADRLAAKAAEGMGSGNGVSPRRSGNGVSPRKITSSARMLVCGD